MQQIQILAVGTLKEAWLTSACAEYQKRLGAFCRIEVLEIAEAKLPKNPSDAQILQGIEAEGERILQKLPSRAYITSLCIEGTQFASETLAQKIDDTKGAYSQLAFVIGGSHGLSQAVKDKSRLKLSMSKMTFPHQLARVMLLEQIYRACSISAGGKYHK